MTAEGNAVSELRDALMRAISEWETYTAEDGYLAIRHRGDRSARDIADAVLALPAVVELREKAAGADRVRKLHRGVVNWSSPECETCSTYCDEDCGHIEPWPCPTIRALDGEQP